MHTTGRQALTRIGRSEETMGGQIAFIGGGNMANAIISGMIEQGYRRDQIAVVEPLAQAREKLKSHLKQLEDAQLE